MKIFNPNNYDLPDDLGQCLDSIYEIFLSKLGLSVDYLVELEIVDSETIKNLNNKYRFKNEETDVLSFPMKTEAHEKFLGSIYFCYSVIASKYDDLTFGFGFLFAHSLLHLAGYSHSKEMFNLQEEIVSEVFGLC